ncbi:hypothetical protein DIS18_08505 [Algibacter marinivivus]|uniref:DUF3500 domain-containing protein n=1 Tax=Algibacter marinivivus TaxID=2100723 RepID=A0A2U2X3F1_9FLAO|nr:DUF3500 domain-containing protein [Algibacter marinivivus]PWH82289.1 hypothetical protein DIS18_08505 [Algibacter marinivivus]
MKRLLILILIVSALSNAQSITASDFLLSLNEDQRKKANLSFDDKNRETWHFLPAVSFPREGIALLELSKEQNALAINFLKNYLSEVGYAKTQSIISLENILAEISGDPIYRDPLKYYIAIYGNPKKDKLWSWSFEGHHISLNFTISEDKISFSPRFLGANPGMVKNGKRKGERVLNKEEDLAFKLINSMTDEQKKQSIFQAISFQEIVTQNQSRVQKLNPVGIQAKLLNKKQQTILVKLIEEYLLTIPKSLAKERFRAIKIAEFDDVYFGWAGSTNLSEGHYYRIQGDTFLIEFDNTQNKANHIHTVWRDFNGDFGRDLIREHYENSEHHKN